MTNQDFLRELIEILRLLEGIIHRYSPPSAVRNLTGTLKRNPTMSIVTLKWTDPTTRTDPATGHKSPLSAVDIANVDIFQSPDAVSPIGSVAEGVQTFTTKDLAPGDYAFMVIVTDTGGRRSAPSNTFTITIPQSSIAPPSAVSDLTGTIS